MPRLILLRHGQSAWNLEGRFAGWGDPPLSPEGIRQARAAGRRMAAAGAGPDAVFCSALARAGQTLALALEGAGAAPGETVVSWRLNERHCGQWQGRLKREIDDARLMAWRDQPQVRPPRLEPDDPRHPRHDPRYKDVPASLLPSGESYADLAQRLRPLWRDGISPNLRVHQCVWVVGHDGSLRSLAAIALAAGPVALDPPPLPPAEPFVLELNAELKVMAAGFLA
ncbi:MAG: 2,3-bisphosphoglycerate-dependent phosphoglycerate mutase [Pseudomonadota bacterium]